MIAAHIREEHEAMEHRAVPDTLPRNQTQTFISFDTNKGEHFFQKKKEEERNENSTFSWSRGRAVLT